MASILLLTAATAHVQATRSKAALESGGHTVTMTPATSTGGLDSAWGAGFDLIATSRDTATATAFEWVRDKYVAGVPVLFGRSQAVGPNLHYVGETAGFISNYWSFTASEGTAQTLSITTAHPITDGYSGSVAVLSGAEYFGADMGTPFGTTLGTTSVTAGSTGPKPSVVAVDIGDPLSSGTATARGAFIGWFAPVTTAELTAAGTDIVLQAVDWLLGGSTPPGPSTAATLTATTAGAAALGRTVTTSATLTATTGGTAVLVDSTPGVVNGSATLTATTSGTATLAGDSLSSATLTATTGGAADLQDATPSDGDTTATLSATTGGAASLAEDTTRVSIGATLTATTGGTAVLDALVAQAARLTVTTGGSVWIKRRHGHDPATGRGTFRLVVAHRDGTRYAELDHATLTGPVKGALNDVDGSGSGLSFAMPKASAKNAHVAQFREVQAERGGHHLGTYVLLRPQDQGTSGDITWQAKGLGWYLTRRRIGPAVRPGLLPKAWRAGYREGSIPAEPPKWSREDAPVLVGPALRVEGSTHVEKTVTRLGSDTTFAPGSAVLSAAGKDSLRAFADEVEVDRDANDLVDIAPPIITIEGHTDDVPDYGPGGNQGLSERRAKAVYDFLAPLVPEGTTMTWVGYGDTRPIVPNHPDTYTGTEANRRVDIVYPKIVSARGHRQYVQDVLTYTNPSAHLQRNLTLVTWWQLESYKEPNADGSIVWLGRRPVGGDDTTWVETAHDAVDDETPLGTWTRSEVTITVPADGQEWEVVARLTPPAGTVVYDEGATELHADDALEFHGVDQATIVQRLIEHAQDPAFDKDDLHLDADCPPTGVTRDLVFYWHDRWTIAQAIEEVVKLADGVDVTIDTTPDRRVVRTHYPRAGQDTTVVLSTLGAVDDYSLALDGEQAATTTIVQADGSGPDREEGVVTGTGDLDLVLEDTWTTEPGTHVGQLAEQARTAHDRYAGHVPLLSVTIDADHTDEMADRVDLGDRVSVDVRSPLYPVTGRHRITEWTLDPDSDRFTYQPTPEV